VFQTHELRRLRGISSKKVIGGRARFTPDIQGHDEDAFVMLNTTSLLKTSCE
jgi:hypothetical protein|tara:strand:+ start:137 stop:292 length:156 start_codon:yes stop_codon:yes gene_type:complete